MGDCGGEEVAVDLVADFVGEVEEGAWCWGIVEVGIVVVVRWEVHD